MNMIRSISKKRWSLAFSLAGAVIFHAWIFLILAIILNFFYPIQSSFENGLGWYLLLAFSYVATFCAFYLLTITLSQREKIGWLIIFLIFLLGSYFPKVFIQNNKNDFSQEDQVYISQTFREMYKNENPFGVKIRSFKNTPDGYSIYIDEYGFFGMRNGYYMQDSGYEGRGTAKSGAALKIIPYLLLGLSLLIFIVIKIIKKLFKNILSQKRSRK